MAGTDVGSAAARLDAALGRLVERGTISPEQSDAILREMAADAAGPAAPDASAAPRRTRTLTDVLIEVGLYVGSALVLAAALALVAQSWDEMGEGTQIALLVTVTLVTAVAGWFLSRGALAGSARRRLAGVVLTVTAASAAGTVALVMGDGDLPAVVALSVALVVMVAAQLLATSAVTEIGMFVAAYALLTTTAEWLGPEPAPDEFGFEMYEDSLYDRLMPLGGVAFGVLWAALAARRLMHRELAIALGLLVALGSAMPLAARDETRAIGLLTLAALAALGFWRFLAEGHWPWIAGAIGSVTAFVFFAVGDRGSPALAFLVAGLVLLGSSALGWRVARRRPADAPTEVSPPPADPGPVGDANHRSPAPP